MNALLWYLSRGTGVTALLALSGALARGILARSGRDVVGWGRFGANEVHRTTSATATALVAVHVLTLVLDPASGISPLHALVPFTSDYQPFGVGLGVLALDVLVLLGVTGVLRRRIGPRGFRAVHWSAYALWPLAVGHFLFSGSDAGTWWAVTALVVSGAAVLAAVAWRLTDSFGTRPVRSADGVLPLTPTAAPR